MANPRKFSEKIALHNQKMQEETAAFEKIMREVCDVKKVEDSAELQPNIENDYSQNTGQISSRESRGRNIGVGGPIRSRPSSRNIDTSPYGGNCSYLSPPSDSSWRRTNSDSAIHKTYNQQNQDSLFYTTDMHSTHSLSTVNSAAPRETPKNNNRGGEGAKSVYNLLDIRSRSATGIPCMPGINVYPSTHDKPSLQSGNTGSLPDLSRFPPSPQNPNGQEPQQTDDSHPPQSNIENMYTSNSPFLSPTGQIERHLPGDYLMLGINVDIKSPKDLSSQYTTQCNVVPQTLPTFAPLYQTDANTIRKNKDDLNNISQHGSNENLIQQSVMNSRSPHRSSAGSSPRLATSFPSNMKYFGSAPSSPTSTILSNGENYEQKSDGFYENQSIHHDFAQFTLVDSIEHIGQSGNLSNYSNQFSYLHDNNLAMEGNGTKNVESGLLSDPMCLYDATHADLFNFSPTHMKKGCGNSTNIPDIEITDYSTGIVDFGREAVPNDLELGQMDIAGLQMLNDPNTNIITDPIIEDSFRRDIH